MGRDSPFSGGLGEKKSFEKVGILGCFLRSTLGDFCRRSFCCENWTKRPQKGRGGGGGRDRWGLNGTRRCGATSPSPPVSIKGRRGTSASGPCPIAGYGAPHSGVRGAEPHFGVRGTKPHIGVSGAEPHIGANGTNSGLPPPCPTFPLHPIAVTPSSPLCPTR